VKSVQSMSFAKEIEFLKSRKKNTKPPLVHQFGFFLDGQEILRCKGRINEATLSLPAKIPALLPPKHWFTELVIRDTHERVKHVGSDKRSILDSSWWRSCEEVCASLRHLQKSVFLTDHQPHLNYQNFVYLMPNLFLIRD
jgi:hypothetical protein